MIILDRLKKSWENDCPEKICSCGNSDCNCQENNNESEPEFVLKENLSDEEIEEIIETEYKDKNRLTIDFIRKALKRHGNRFSYEKTELIRGDKRFKNSSNRTAIVTCHVHNGDIEIGTQYFVSDRYHGCFECNHGHPKTKTHEQFLEELEEAHPNYKLLPGEKYVNAYTKLKLHCETHDIDFEAAPVNLVVSSGLYSDHKFSCPQCAKENRFEIDKAARILREIKLKDRIKKEYGDTYDILRINLYYLDDCVEIHCKNCNTDSKMSGQTAISRLDKGYILCDCCRKEKERIDRENEFRQKVYTKFPGRFNLDNLHYDYNNTLATGLKCLVCGKEFNIGSPVHFIQDGGHCPCCNISGGENMVYNWLLYHKDILTFEWQYKIDNSIVVGRKDYYSVIIDFKFEYNDKVYFIEYNGEQHYTWTYFHKSVEDFEGQLRRDQNIRDYCSSSGIILIEIPFTYYNQRRISSLLDEIVLNNKNPNDLINIPPINYYRTKKDREEAEKDGRL